MFETLLYFNKQCFDLGAGAVRPSAESTNSNYFYLNRYMAFTVKVAWGLSKQKSIPKCTGHAHT